jgi:hypothetical protein
MPIEQTNPFPKNSVIPKGCVAYVALRSENVKGTFWTFVGGVIVEMRGIGAVGR